MPKSPVSRPLPHAITLPVRAATPSGTAPGNTRPHPTTASTPVKVRSGSSPCSSMGTWSPSSTPSAHLKGGRLETHHRDRPRPCHRNHPPRCPPPPPLRYSALRHSCCQSPSTAFDSGARPCPCSLPALITHSPARARRSSVPAAAIVVALPPRLPLLRPTSPPPRCTRGASNVIDPGRTMRSFLAFFCRW